MMGEAVHGKADMASEGVARRSLFGQLGAGVAGAAALSALVTGGLAGSASPAQAQAAITDLDIANFALNLEYLEAEFYLRAVTGQGLADSDTTGTGTRGNVTGGSRVPFRASYVAQFAQRLAIEEQAHVKFLRSVLGANAVSRPPIDLQNSFTVLARAAGLINASQTFNPFADDVSFLLGTFIFEDVGVTAYGGAAPLISNRDILAYAASILAVEAYHSGAVRTFLASIGAGGPVQAISDLRDTLSGPGEDDQGIVIPGVNNFVIAPVDSQGQTFRRTPRQVLNIVYGAINASSGLFFPSGMNGTIRA